MTKHDTPTTEAGSGAFGIDQSVEAVFVHRSRGPKFPRTAKYCSLIAHRLTLSAMLNEEERAILDFERAAWREPGPKDQAIEMRLGLTAADYYERLRSLALGAAALAYDPLTTKRVLAIIDQPTETGLAVQ